MNNGLILNKGGGESSSAEPLPERVGRLVKFAGKGGTDCYLDPASIEGVTTGPELGMVTIIRNGGAVVVRSEIRDVLKTIQASLPAQPPSLFGGSGGGC